MEQIDNHRSLKIWLTIVLGSVLFSNLFMLWSPGVTGYIAYDTGPNVDLNPDFISTDQLYSQATTTLVALGAIIGAQVLIYTLVTRIYNDVE
jgi:predicted Abi (CAAX) family protease